MTTRTTTERTGTGIASASFWVYAALAYVVGLGAYCMIAPASGRLATFAASAAWNATFFGVMATILGMRGIEPRSRRNVAISAFALMGFASAIVAVTVASGIFTATMLGAITQTHG